MPRLEAAHASGHHPSTVSTRDANLGRGPTLPGVVTRSPIRTIVSIVLVLSTALLSLLLSQPAKAATATTLTPQADTALNKGAPSSSYGSASTLYGSKYGWRSLLRFPTAQLDDNARVVSAKLRVFSVSSTRSKWQVRSVAGEWSESTTYNTSPELGSTVLGTSGQYATSGRWNEITLPPSAVSVLANTDLAVLGTSKRAIGFQSRENASAPQLVLELESGPAAPPADTTAPETSISSGPASSTTSTSASFSFSSNEPGTFECQLDASAYQPCTSPATYSSLAAGSHTFRVRAKDAAGNVDPSPASHGWTITTTQTTPPTEPTQPTPPTEPTEPTQPAQPAGPAGPWTLAFSDEFNGTSLDTSKWSPNWFGEGGRMNNVGTYSSNVAVTGGNLVLTLSSPSAGALVHTDYGPGRYQLPVGGYVEARVSFPGNGSTFYNWPAWWASGPSWPNAGEHDIAEVLGGDLTVNYHGPGVDKNMGTPPGSFMNEFHTYGVYRKAGSADVYWDGVLVRSYPTTDNGQGEELIFNVGAGSWGSPVTMTGAQGAMKVDWVRAWRR